MVNNYSYFEALQKASSVLIQQNKDGAALKFLLLERLNWNLTDWLLYMKDPIPEKVFKQLERDAEELAKDMPPQYILGYSYFYNEKFYVNQDTLIPRPETEELVALCIHKVSTDTKLSVVDIGTGSGVIALTLKQQMPNWNIKGTDISEGALRVAQKNANHLKCEVDFIQGKTCAPLIGKKWDIVISNPPYIGKQEKKDMDESVKRYEPETALYAANDGLAIYQELARELPNYTKKTSWLFFEIGYQQGTTVQDLFKKAFPTHQVIIHQDLNGQDRMISIEPTY